MRSVDIASKLKEARVRAGFTQKYVYEKIGVPQSTFSSWETGKSEPNAETFLNLCNMYGIKSLDELGIESTIESLSASELAHIKKYRTLDDHGRKNVDFILNSEYERASQVNSLDSSALNEFARELSDEEVAKLAIERYHAKRGTARMDFATTSGNALDGSGTTEATA